MPKVKVTKGVADMSPCMTCGATVHEMCKMHRGMPVANCPSYVSAART